MIKKLKLIINYKNREREKDVQKETKEERKKK